MSNKYIIFFFLFFCNRGYSQVSLDLLIRSIKNDSLEIGLISSPAVDLSEGKAAQKNGKRNVIIQRKYAMVSSFLTADGGIDQLVKKYGKAKVIGKLIPYLQDTTRDFYANALLYEVADHKKLVHYFYLNRQQWIDKSIRQNDIEHWLQYKKDSL